MKLTRKQLALLMSWFNGLNSHLVVDEDISLYFLIKKEKERVEQQELTYREGSE